MDGNVLCKMVVINDRWAPLHLALSNGHTEVVKLLLEKRADLLSPPPSLRLRESRSVLGLGVLVGLDISARTTSRRIPQLCLGEVENQHGCVG